MCLHIWEWVSYVCVCVPVGKLSVCTHVGMYIRVCAFTCVCARACVGVVGMHVCVCVCLSAQPSSWALEPACSADPCAASHQQWPWMGRSSRWASGPALHRVVGRIKWSSTCEVLSVTKLTSHGNYCVFLSSFCGRESWFKPHIEPDWAHLAWGRSLESGVLLHRQARPTPSLPLGESPRTHPRCTQQAPFVDVFLISPVASAFHASSFRIFAVGFFTLKCCN